MQSFKKTVKCHAGVTGSSFLNGNSKSRRTITLSTMIESEIQNHTHIFIPEQENPQSFKKTRMKRLGVAIKSGGVSSKSL